MIKECQNCKIEFEITDEDLNFYTKISVPPPAWCPDCRLQRRLAFRESRTLYTDECKKCNTKLVSIYNPKLNINVYCNNCWWGDSWDSIDYAQNYDFSKPFFQQFYELRKKVPKESTGSRNCENCEFSNGDVRSKNCLLTYDCLDSINLYNCQIAVSSRDSIDVDSSMSVESGYCMIASNNIYNSKFIYNSHECLDSSFLYNCIGCSSCFGCVNLRHKKYYIFNKPYSKENYLKEIKKWDLSSYKNILKAQEKFWFLYYQKPHRFALIKNSTNVTGEDIINSKNCKNCFFTRFGIENCKFIFACGLLLKDSYDATFGGDRSELFYETNGGMQSQRCFFTRAALSCRDNQYCDRNFNSNNLFGCVHLKNKQYCILNKQYEKEEYFKMVEKIKQHMNDMPYVDKKGRIYKYGEFFPSELSFHEYNYSWGNKFAPLSKEEALNQGFNWLEEDKEYQIDIKNELLPDLIGEVKDDILNKKIECAHLSINCNHECTKVFKILPNELAFYRKMNLALPRLCPHCRHYERIKTLHPIKLWERSCMKNNCPNKFQTAISPNSPEIVYCEECYKKEVY